MDQARRQAGEQPPGFLPGEDGFFRVRFLWEKTPEVIDRRGALVLSGGPGERLGLSGIGADRSGEFDGMRAGDCEIDPRRPRGGKREQSASGRENHVFNVKIEASRRL